MWQKHKNIEKLFLSVIIIFSVLSNIYSQDGSVIQFAVGSRFDFIGLKNFDDTNHGLLHGEADVSASVLTEDLGLFKGGEFYVQAMGIFGNKSSENYSGDLQVFSNIESDNRIFLYQAYYKQIFNNLTIQLGQLDLNADYSVSRYGSTLINSSFGVIPTISLNMPVSIFSYLGAGISFQYTLSNSIALQTAFFDGDPGNYETNRYSLNWHFKKDEGFFNATELQYRTKNKLKPGKYKAGIFYHSKTFTDTDEMYSSKGNFGFYVIGDQQLTSESNSPENGLGMFFEISYSPSMVNLIGSYYALGLVYRGIFKGLNEDECAVAVASAHIGKNTLYYNPDYLSHETALEFTYKKYLTHNVVVQPDIQYIINTGASRLLNGNVTIGLLRTMLIF